MIHGKSFEKFLTNRGPLKSAFVNFFSFITFGCIPLLIYIVTSIVFAIWKIQTNDTHRLVCFLVDCAITFVTLIIMGAIRSRFSDQKWYIAIAFTVLVGVISSGSAYLIAFGLDKIFHIGNV